MVKRKTVLLAVTGSVAAYKAAEIARSLIKKDLNVRVAMTKAATKFITPFTLEVLTGNQVATSLFEGEAAKEIYHLSIAEEADLILVAPATANIIAKAAVGVADDVISCTLISANLPIIFAPAMHSTMYLSEATQKNISVLKERGCVFVGPEVGELAKGKEDIGRLAEIEKIVDAVLFELKRKDDFLGKKVVVTAGGTREPLDPIRFLSNRSSGKMGYALAKEAKKRGAEVTLIMATQNSSYLSGINTVFVETALEMKEAVRKNFRKADVLVKAAAVADFRPRVARKAKIKKSEDLKLSLTRNPDILGKLGKIKKANQVLVGFAAETENLVKNAKEKLKRKNLDLVVATDVTKESSGFGKESIEFTLVGDGKKVEEFPLMSKNEAARIILDKVLVLLKGK